MKFLILFIFFSFLIAEKPDKMAKASAAMKAGMYKEALIHLKDVESTDSSSPEIYRLKALLHEALNENDKAIIAWKNCLKYSVDESLSSEAKIHIQSLSSD